MSWRVVVVSSRAKLDYKMGSMVIRSEDDEKRLHIEDISVLILESTAVSLTAYLLAELVAKKVKIIFCDNVRNPLAELIPYHGSYNSSGRIRSQIKWADDVKAKIWQAIVKEKINQQAQVLKDFNYLKESEMLQQYANDVQPADITNREGHAAKVYFNNLFDEDFYRNGDDPRNAVLNYGYTILLSSFNREIAASGYLTQIGLWHDNASNPFNLGSDLMEPFRPIIDRFASQCGFTKFEKDEKLAVIDILNQKVKIDETSQYVNNAIGIYARSVFQAIEEKDIGKILFYKI
jgi:CRISPR-associated endonuclease Cas1 subtype II